MQWDRATYSTPALRSYSKHITAYIHVATYRRNHHPAPQLFVAGSLACWKALGHCRGRANPAMHVARNGRVSGNRSGGFSGKVRAGTPLARSAQRRPLAGAKGESQHSKQATPSLCSVRKEEVAARLCFSQRIFWTAGL